MAPTRAEARLQGLCSHFLPHHIDVAALELGASTWSILLKQTEFRQEATFNDPDIPSTIRYLQNKVEYPESPLEKRMAYLRLWQVFLKLQQLVAFGRQNMDICSGQGQRNHCLVIELCLESLPAVSRYQISNYRRIAKRWSILAGTTALTLALYPESIDSFVNNHRRVTNKDLYYIARHIVRRCSEKVEAQQMAELIQRFSRLQI